VPQITRIPSNISDWKQDEMKVSVIPSGHVIVPVPHEESPTLNGYLPISLDAVVSYSRAGQ